MLRKIFVSIQEKKEDWLNFNEGEHLEEKLAISLKKGGFNRLDREELREIQKTEWSKLKEKIKNGDLITNNFPTWTAKSFVQLPYGKQDYPDFLVFTKKHIIPVEVKSSSKEGVKPMWNSHLPKENGLYIFASSQKDITFFRGVDVIDNKLSFHLKSFFARERELEKEFVKNIPKSTRGWKVYVRIAYDQVSSLLSSNQHKINFFQHPQRKETEDNVLNWLTDLEKKLI